MKILLSFVLAISFFLTIFSGEEKNQLQASCAVHPSEVHDLVEVVTICPDILLDIKYATTDNFTKQKVYTEAQCFLRKEVVQKLVAVQQELKKSGIGLKIFDGYRPRRIQYKFWELVPDERYVADPKKGSKHNRGSAVDVTLVRLSDSSELEMPSAFDDFTEKAHRKYDSMTSEAAKNCRLLESVMVAHGFIPLPTEWWHFDDADWQKYDLLDIPLGLCFGD